MPEAFPVEPATSRYRAPLALFVGFFAAYLYTMPPYLAAYRDAGEMATSAATLGVSHPPSYPLYILLGKLSQALPFATPAFRLTLLSAALAAACVAGLFLVLAPVTGAGAAALASLWLGCNRIFWSVAIVPEMYALSLLQGVALLGLALRLRQEYDPRLWRGFVFLYGLFLGNRTDLLLWAPGLAWLVFSAGQWRRAEGAPLAWLLRSVGWAALGLSVYFYLPLRSSAGPWLDWNHPAVLKNFIGSLTRRSYGGTLDLLSKSYATGELFGENLRVYARHLWTDYLGVGAWLPLAGLWAWWRRDRAAAVGLALAFLASGPLFLFLANLPPNPHALAIVDPHYLLPDLVLAVLAAGGAAALRDAATPLGVPAALLLAVGLAPLWHRWDVSRRWNLLNYDFSRNVLLSVPRGATLISKKDVPLFTLWYAQAVEGLRPDVKVVAQGLAASPWYQQARRRAGDMARLMPLREPADWVRFAALNGDSYVTTDAELPGGLTLGPPRGLIVSLSTATQFSEDAWRFIARRGDYRYDAQPDFFSSDLIEAYAVTRQRAGSWLIEHGREAEGERPLRLGWAMKRLMPDAAMFLAYGAFRRGRLEEAEAAYVASAQLFEEMLALATAYRSLPDVFGAARRGLADASLNLGVVLERLGRREEAAARYRTALEADPRSAQAHYNLAVLYWDKDWDKVIAEMSEVLRLDPGRQDAARYLQQARFRKQAQRLGK